METLAARVREHAIDRGDRGHYRSSDRHDITVWRAGVLGVDAADRPHWFPSDSWCWRPAASAISTASRPTRPTRAATGSPWRRAPERRSPTRNSCSSTPPPSTSAPIPRRSPRKSLRGEGALIVDKNDHRFLADIDPAAELAARDIVARGVFDSIAKGKRRLSRRARRRGRGIPEKIPDRLRQLHGGGHRPRDRADPHRARRALSHGRRRDRRAMAAPACPAFGRRAKSPAPACTAPIASPPTRCWRRWCSARASPPDIAADAAHRGDSRRPRSCRNRARRQHDADERPRRGIARRRWPLNVGVVRDGAGPRARAGARSRGCAQRPKTRERKTC